MWNRLHVTRFKALARHFPAGWILDQADGTDALRPGPARRSFAADPEWLP